MALWELTVHVTMVLAMSLIWFAHQAFWPCLGGSTVLDYHTPCLFFDS